MRHVDRRLVALLGLVAWLALLADGCAVRPVPEPPSVDTSRMSLTQESSDTVSLVGASGAIPSGGAALRVSNPASGDRSQVFVGGSGEFAVVLRGVRSDVLYLELLHTDSDDFFLAVTGGEGTAVAKASPGADQDGDDSPDAIDCASGDPSINGSRCGAPACAVDSDCPAYQTCVYGSCVTESNECTPTVEICENGLDDDCDGTIDDGCQTATGCATDGDCGAGQSCVGGICTVCSPTAEICGNGIDDDCDGQIDDGC